MKIAIRFLYMYFLLFTMFTIVSLLNLFITPAFATGTAAQQTSITSTSVRYEADAQRVIFTGKVHVIQEDVQIWADKMTVLLKKDTVTKPVATESSDSLSSQPAEIEKIIAERNVRFTRGETVGTCQKATYTTDNGVLVMDDTPVLTEGEKTIKGFRIIFRTRQNTSEVLSSGDSRVTVTFPTPTRSSDR